MTNGTPRQEQDRDFHITGQGVAGNVLGAVGSWLTTREGGQPAAPRNPSTLPSSNRSTGLISPGTSAFPGMLTPRRTGNTANEPNGAAASNHSTARSSMPSIFPTSQNLTGRPLVTQPSVLPAGQNLTGRRVSSTGRPVISTRAQQRALPVTANNQRVRGVNAQGQRPVISTRAQQQALPVTANRQRVADVNAAKRPLSAAQDPYNWAGIARDLGNAGDRRWAAHKTGALPSTNALRFVRGNQQTAEMEVNRARTRSSLSAPATTPRASNRGGRGRNQAV